MIRQLVKIPVSVTIVRLGIFLHIWRSGRFVNLSTETDVGWIAFLGWLVKCDPFTVAIDQARPHEHLKL